MANPYLITGPALISFSFGRTSGFMLKKILDAHDGQLPEDVHVVFTNTGKEDERTLRFGHECATRWGQRIYWLERDGPDGFREVGYNSASRNGEPFAALIRENGYLPNIANPWCSIALKQRVTRQFAMHVFGPGRYQSVIGLRADEPGRVRSARKRTATKKDAWDAVMPLADDGVSNRDVRAYWDQQDFDIGRSVPLADCPPDWVPFMSYEGNCNGCFQKGPRLYEMARYHPESFGWWIEQERAVEATAEPDCNRWILGRSYQEFVDAARYQPDLLLGAFDDDPDEGEECGIYCGGGAQ